MSTSPTPGVIASATNSPVPQITMNFYQALKAAVNGARITKLEWKDTEHYGLFRIAVINDKPSNVLMLHKPDGQFYQWIINDGDALGTDWVILQPPAD